MRPDVVESGEGWGCCCEVVSFDDEQFTLSLVVVVGGGGPHKQASSQPASLAAPEACQARNFAPVSLPLLLAIMYAPLSHEKGRHSFQRRE